MEHNRAAEEAEIAEMVREFLAVASRNARLGKPQQVEELAT